MPGAPAAEAALLQLEFPIARDPEIDLPIRLRQLGWPPSLPLALQSTRTVLVSIHPRKGARVHRGYAMAPDAVLRALVAYASSPRRGARADARLFLEFPVHDFVPRSGRRRRTERAEDGPILARLRAMHTQLNARCFEGLLAQIPIAVSRRMHRRLGELRLERRGTNRAAEIVISWKHIQRDRWREVEATLLHEMVHQWQDATGRPVDHGRDFREKAAALGIEPRAVSSSRRYI